MRKYSLREKWGMLRSRISIIVEDLQTKTNVPINKRIKLLAKGFYSWHYTLYDLENNNIKEYLSEFQRRKARFINGQAAYVLNNKLVCDQIIRRYVRTAAIFSIILDGIVYSIDDEIVIKDVYTLINYLEEIGPLILKPNIGTDGGRGIILIKMENGKIISNGRQIYIDKLRALVESLNEYIVCEFIRQGNYGNYLFSETVNSIRILIMMSPQDYKPFIATAVQRIGTYMSKPVDNWSSGGISAYIDINAGALSKAVSFKDGVVKYCEIHPDTGTQIEGLVIPNWEKVKNSILRLASKLPYLPYVAWDVVPLKEGILIIEANNCSDVSFLQIQEPLLKNEKVEEFYKYHGII